MTVCWVLAYIGIPQNEIADEAAKIAAESDSSVSNSRVHYKDYYPVFKRKVHEEWEESWRDLTNNKLRSIKDTVNVWSSSQRKNRREEVLLCRLRIGHTKLTHGWLMDGTQQPRCQNCNEPLTVKHLLVGCVHLNRVRTRIYPMSALSINERTGCSEIHLG